MQRACSSQPMQQARTLPLSHLPFFCHLTPLLLLLSPLVLHSFLSIPLLLLLLCNLLCALPFLLLCQLLLLPFLLLFLWLLLLQRRSSPLLVRSGPPSFCIISLPLSFPLLISN